MSATEGHYTHDDSACLCAADEEAIAGLKTWGTTDKEWADPSCVCACRKCVERKIRHDGLVRRARLETRLRKANINPSDLAELMWHYVADGLESWVRTITVEELQENLVKLKLHIGTIRIDPYSVQNIGKGK